MNKKFRHELKYFINYQEYEYLRHRLKHAISMDKHIVSDNGYHIRSLYFDDLNWTGLHEKEDGYYERQKFRIRIYNESKELIRLEKKVKIGNMTRKDQVIIDIDQYKKICRGEIDDLIYSEHQLLRELFIQMRVNLLEPKVIVDYDREAYTVREGNVRVTFDMNLRAVQNTVDIFDTHIATRQIFEEPILILEIKYDEYLPSYVKNLLQIQKHNISAISKYALCARQVRLLRV